MKRLLALPPILLLVPALSGGESEYADLARRFADEMIAQGTDRWAHEHSPQFASMLLRSSPPTALRLALYH